MNIWKDIKFCNYKIRHDINYIKIPVTKVNTIEEWNCFYRELYNDKRYYHGIKRTKSGGISTKVDLKDPSTYATFRWDACLYNNWCAEIIIIGVNGLARIQLNNSSKESDNDKVKSMCGSKALIALDKELKKDGIDLSSYKLDKDEGKRIAETIEKPIIGKTRSCIIGNIYKNVNHIDLNSAYPAGLVNGYPEMKTTIERIYKKKQDKTDSNHEMYKGILNMAIGIMHSKYKGYKYAQLAKAAKKYCNDRIKEMTNKLILDKCIILMYNTDGIWYIGNSKSVKDSNELGEFKMDHKNCTFRAVTAANYEFIENGVYTPVVRGKTQLDKIKPRDKWEWGDANKEIGHEYIQYELNNKYGLMEIM